MQIEISQYLVIAAPAVGYPAHYKVTLGHEADWEIIHRFTVTITKNVFTTHEYAGERSRHFHTSSIQTLPTGTRPSRAYVICEERARGHSSLLRIGNRPHDIDTRIRSEVTHDAIYAVAIRNHSMTYVHNWPCLPQPFQWLSKKFETGCANPASTFGKRFSRSFGPLPLTSQLLVRKARLEECMHAAGKFR
jgi:hypothetical protein